MPVISVIVPICNAEDTIKRCVSSVLKQTFTEFELVLINDGSTDHSPKICNQLAEKDQRIVVLHIPNSGVSNARNVGLKAAKGQYIAFLDSDDWFEPDMLAVQHNNLMMHNCQLAIAGIYVDYPDKATQLSQYPIKGLIAKTEYSKILNDFYHLPMMALWNKLFVKEIISKNALKFEIEMSYSEDVLFIINYLFYVDKIYISSQPLYHYVQKNNWSLTRKFNPFSPLNNQWVNCRLKKLAELHNTLTPELIMTMNEKYYSHVHAAIYKMFGYDKWDAGQKKEYLSWLLNDQPTKDYFAGQKKISAKLLATGNYALLSAYYGLVYLYLDIKDRKRRI